LSLAKQLYKVEEILSSDKKDTEHNDCITPSRKGRQGRSGPRQGLFSYWNSSMILNWEQQFVINPTDVISHSISGLQKKKGPHQLYIIAKLKAALAITPAMRGKSRSYYLI